VTRSEIWIGDLVRAVRVLRVTDDATRRQVADLLGFESTSTSPGLSRTDEEPNARPHPPSVADDVRAPAPSHAGTTTERSLARLPALGPLTATSGTAPAAPPVTAVELSGVTSMAPSTPPSLLDPLASRFIAKAMITSVRLGPEPDIDRIVGLLARLEAPDPLPLEHRHTLARGVQVLIDVNEGCEPFASDQADMVARIQRLAGPTLVEVHRFDEVPDTEDTFAPWSPPRPGATVLALTDFGLGGRGRRNRSRLVAGWQEAADLLGRRGSALVALVPYPSARWPPSLVGVVRMVAWDRPTTASAARIARADPR
jgi:hypothetical protein